MRYWEHGNIAPMTPEVCRPRQRWPSWVMRAALRLSIGAACAVAGAQWATAVQARRNRIISVERYVPVPEMCEERSGYWWRCAWVPLSGRFVDRPLEPLVADHLPQSK